MFAYTDIHHSDMCPIASTAQGKAKCYMSFKGVNEPNISIDQYKVERTWFVALTQ